MATKFKIKKNDEVVVLSGKNKGQRGIVVKVITDKKRVLVAGLNMVKRHERQSQVNPSGGIVEKEASIHISNVAYVDPKEDKPTKIGYKVLKDGKKVRVARKSGEILDS